MLDKIKLKMMVSTAVIAIISVFTMLLTWVGVSVWWLISGDMVHRLTFLYIYIIITLIPMLVLWVGTLKKTK